MGCPESGFANFPVEPFQIVLIAIADGLIISRMVRKGFRVIAVIGFVLFIQIELAGVSGKPEIKLQVFHCVQRIGIILFCMGIGGHAREFCVVKKRWDIGDEYTVRSSLILHIEKEAAGSLGMTRMVQRDDLHITQSYGIPVVQQSICFYRLENKTMTTH
jgi:hypothetical protein